MTEMNSWDVIHVQVDMRRISPRKYVYLVLFVCALMVVVWYVRDDPSPVQGTPYTSSNGRSYTGNNGRDAYLQHTSHTYRNGPSSLNTHTDHNGETYYRIPQGTKPDGERCLHSNPPVHEEEFLPHFKGSEGGYVCDSDYEPPIMWDINFNIERDFRFCKNRENCPEVTHHGIPKRLHFIWSTEMIPDIFVKNLKAFKRIHPKWEIHFWTIRSGREFIKSREPQLLTYFDHYRREVDRADMLRYVILYYYGGAYFDLDSTPVRPLDPLTEQHDCIVGPEPIENAVVLLKTRSVLANSGIMCMAKHAFTRFLIDSLPIHGRRLAGPLFFSNCFNSYLRSRVSPSNVQVGPLKSKNKTAPSLVENISIVRHEYFEFYLNNIVNVSGIMVNECPKYRDMAKKYIKNCKTNRSREPDINCEVPPSSNGWSTKLFQACVEWILHGGRKRSVGKSQIFLKHEHYGTYTKTNFALHHPGPNITDILPHAILHIQSTSPGA